MPREKKIIGLAVFFGFMVWILDSTLDYFFFYEGTFLQLLILDIPAHELYTRTVIIIFFLLFGFTVANVASKQKRAEDALELKKEELRETTNLFSLFIRNSPIYAFVKEVTATESRVIRASDNYKDMIGIPGPEMVGKTMEELFPAELAKTMSEDDWSVVSKGINLKIDEELNGRRYTTFKFPIKVGSRNLLAGYTLDITDQQAAEEEVRRRENQLKQIFEIIPIGLWFADKDGTLLRCNPKGIEIWGAEQKFPISELGIFKAWRLPSQEPIGPDDWSLIKSINEGLTITNELLEIEAFDGKRKTILNYSAPVMNSDGSIDGAIVVNLDISDQRALENQLQQAQKMESIGRLAGGVAHDFNNMLSIILGHSELIMSGIMSTNPIYNSMQEITGAAKRSADLTRQLLAFARKQTILPQVIDLNHTVENMMKMLQRLIGEHISLTWYPGESLDLVNMDPSQVDQILANLCVNARDAIADKGEIVIKTENIELDQEFCAHYAYAKPGTFVMLTVSDNGSGIDNTIIDDIFEPFFTTKTSDKGTGLGLSTVYGIVKQNNGFINVYSETERGTTIKIYFHAHKSIESNNEVVRTQRIPTGNGETILIVEDNTSILKLTHRILSELNYSVLSANSPSEAINLFNAYEHEIHLLITDVIMPEMHGLDLRNKLLLKSPELKCIFMSGYTANTIAHHGVLDEGIIFIQKPFTKRKLADVVNETLTKPVLPDKV